MKPIKTDTRPIAVTDLAQLARCEQQMLLDQEFGKQRPISRERQARAGNAEHERHDRLARQYQGSGSGRRRRTRDSRCFVASAVYGDTAWQTEVLRDWRDRVLLPSRLGRVLVRLYYRCSPTWARWVSGHPHCVQSVRWLLDRIVARVAHPTRGKS